MFAWVITSGVSVVLILLIRWIFKGKISLWLQYALWLLVLVRLLIPVNVIDTDISILKFVPLLQETGGFLEQNQVMDSKTRTPTGMSSSNTMQSGPLGVSVNIVSSGQRATGQTEPLRDGMLGVSRSQSDKAAQKETPLWQQILIGIWVLGMAVVSVVIAGVNLGFARRLRRAREVMDIREGTAREGENSSSIQGVRSTQSLSVRPDTSRHLSAGGHHQGGAFLCASPRGESLSDGRPCLVHAAQFVSGTALVSSTGVAGGLCEPPG